MYTKDKQNRITLRLNDEQFAFIKYNADVMGVSPSEFLRIMVNSTMTVTRQALTDFKPGRNTTEVAGRENDKADQHDIV